MGFAHSNPTYIIYTAAHVQFTLPSTDNSFGLTLALLGTKKMISITTRLDGLHRHLCRRRKSGTESGNTLGGTVSCVRPEMTVRHSYACLGASDTRLGLSFECERAVFRSGARLRAEDIDTGLGEGCALVWALLKNTTCFRYVACSRADDFIKTYQMWD